jgi:hypothetical protein
MPRYHFQLNECGRVLADNEGRELPADADFRRIAIDEARAIMQAEIGEGRLCLGCAVEVCTEDGALVARVSFQEAVTVAGLDGCEALD